AAHGAWARRVGVPTLPMTVDPADAGRVGFPVLVKASAGGGGKGMRIVDDPGRLDGGAGGRRLAAARARLDEAVAAARREARAPFGDDTLSREPYIPPPRHIEVQ